MEQITQFVRQYSILPDRFQNLMIKGLEQIRDPHERGDLCKLVCSVSNAAWKGWIAARPPEDNRQEHEWIVFSNVVRITENEGFTLEQKRIATAFAFTHDSYFIKRIMEVSINRIEDEAKRIEETNPEHARQLYQKAGDLYQKKANQRIEHMQKGAETARKLLVNLNYLNSSNPLLTEKEINTCCTIISKHDLWKTGEPYPSGNDKLALACVEADALWPLHPLGVLADLERPDENGQVLDPDVPENWRLKASESLRTLIQFRKNWKGLTDERFLDNESIFRTKEGFRLFTQWRRFWGI